MNSSYAEQALPEPPDDLAFGDVALKLDGIVPGDPSKGFVPYYHFRILANAHTEVGHINLRVGDTDHVRLCAGHIGFAIDEPHRGRRYALQACRALAPFARAICAEVTITCNPDNIPSRRTIENLGARFVDESDVPPHEPAYQRGDRRKRRYRWTP